MRGCFFFFAEPVLQMFVNMSNFLFKKKKKTRWRRPYCQTQGFKMVVGDITVGLHLAKEAHGSIKGTRYKAVGGGAPCMEAAQCHTKPKKVQFHNVSLWGNIFCGSTHYATEAVITWCQSGFPARYSAWFFFYIVEHFHP